MDRLGVLSLVQESWTADRYAVNNALSGSPKSLMEETKENIDTVMGTAFYGPIFLIQNVVPKMPRGGRIISESYILSA